MGTSEFAVPSLEILLANGYPISAVVTAPDKPRGRGQILSPTPIKSVALRHGLPVLQPEFLRDPEFTSAIRALHPALIVVVAFRILPKGIFSIPSLGSFNLHASLLPKYRGAAPINWAIINGEKETGVTTFFLEEKVDTGTMLLQARVPIKPDDDAGSLHDTLAEVGAEIVLHTVRLIEQGKAVPRKQDDTLASPAPKLFKQHCRIHWNQPAEKIHNHIRGLSPLPAAFTMHNGKVIKLFRTLLTDRKSDAEPGNVRVEGKMLHVCTADNFIGISELQLEGRKRMGTEEFLRGYHLTSGEKLT
ncbi:MAG: methionyl-tRNA formyltransferase [Bacteroidetes bacterium]|nr:methionyl-tRNA formyltransferase [Bacteroidota bacterium]MCW5895234.1 methionyl-tRNA formyltransferase [Bacteroidota bacterium]